LGRISRAGVVALIACALCALAAAPQAGAAKAKAKKIEKRQKQILNRSAVKVKVKAKRAGKVKVKAYSKTFDDPKYKKLTRAVRLRFARPGTETAKLKLTAKGRDRVSACEARTLQIRVGKGKHGKTAKLKRNSRECRPQPIDLSRAGDCAFYGAPEGLCLMPFPDDYYTVKDGSTATGRRLALHDGGMPQNARGVPITAQPYNASDGFSPGQTIVLRVPGLDTPQAFSRTNPIPLNDLSRNETSEGEKTKEPIVVIDATSRERVPIWVELDSNSSSAADTTLLIHPATNFESGHRYIVAMRKLRDAAGNKLPAPEGFRYFRDDLPSNEQAINDQRKRFDKIFRTLRGAKIKRANLYLAWDFTVASDQNIAERLLHIRDDAFAQLGDTNLADVVVQGSSPSFAVTSVENLTPAEDPELARRVQGTFEVPCYLVPSCAPGGTFQLGADGLPDRNGTFTADFNCGIPRAAVDAPGAAPARPQVYGHGLLGSASQATSSDQQSLGQAHNFVICATTTIGFSSGDVPNIASNILPQLGNFPQLTDRVQQGLLNTLFLGRLMIHPDGFSSDAAFHVDDADVGSPPVIDTSRLYYNGNSQGGILGGAATAVAPDWTRASLGVPAMNYSVLLNRSIDFDTYKLIFDPSYPNPMTQQLALSLIQILWDRSEPNGYAHRMTDDPLPNTPQHEVLLNVALGDHQVTNYQADVEARTIGAQVHAPVVYDGRWPNFDVAWGIPRIASYPFADSAIVYWDGGPVRPDPMDPGELIGTDVPPLGNVPNRTGEDPHGLPRDAPEEQQMVSDFLRPDPVSSITDTCGGGPCFDGGFTGP
jgi:hypothetical protein